VTLRETYLDWNATAPLRPEAAAAMRDAMTRCGNPSSVHRWGRAARQAIEAAREKVAALGAVRPANVIFTSGGTEANHLALRGCGRERVLISAVEHSSVLQAVPGAELIPVDANGVVDPDTVAALLAKDKRPAIVSVMYANNETGVFQLIQEIAHRTHAHGALLHCDMVQAAGKIPLAVVGLGVDIATVSAHKIGGPAGVGAVLTTGPIELAPTIRGGGQEQGQRTGTENIIGIAGFGAAAEMADAEVMDTKSPKRMRILRDRLEDALGPEAIALGRGTWRLPNTSAIAMPGMAAETQVIAFDLAGIMVSAGAACSSGKVGPSHVLAAMGIAPEIANSTIRVSLGWTTTEADIDHFIDTWTALYARLGRRRRAA